jgi:trans-aconitate methyltransferase
MTLTQAIELIKPAVNPEALIWADIGAGTGMFTQALMVVLESAFTEASADGGGSRESLIYAVDKTPHALWSIKSTRGVEIIVVEADFNNPLNLSPLDGIVMANALHYAQDHIAVLKNVLQALKSGGVFILIEYDTETANPPWVPNPVSLKTFESLCKQLDLPSPVLIHRIKSVYGDAHLYSAWTRKD